MDPFTSITAIAAPIDEANVDTNQLCPSRFSKVPRGPAYAQVLLHDQRFNADGSEKDFVLNRDPFRRAKILVADRGFGCGSSRETAVYALYEFGIRCVIAPSFGDIHAANCAKNGILAAPVSEAAATSMRRQLRQHPGATFTVDLERQTITDAEGQIHHFPMNVVRKRCLLQGLDDIGRTEHYRPQLENFESAYRGVYLGSSTNPQDTRRHEADKCHTQDSR
jgi:3-isopropylmalate/(R)-2-methylmalate dehydratase small subunit